MSYHKTEGFFLRKKIGDSNEIGNPEASIMWGRMKFKQEDFQGAIDAFDKAIELSPNYGKAYLNRALAKDKLKDHDGAISDFDIAIALFPKNGAAYIGRGISYLQLGDKDSAKSDWKIASKLGFKLGDELIKNQLEL